MGIVDRWSASRLVIDLDGNWTDRLAPGSINLRLAAVAGLYEYLMMADPTRKSPIPKGKPINWFAAGGTDRAAGPHQTPSRAAVQVAAPHASAAILIIDTPRKSGRCWEVRARPRDLAMAGLMLYCWLRSCEVLALAVTDVDIGGRRLPVDGKGGKDRHVPRDGDLAAVIDTHLLTERPDAAARALFVVAKGPTRGVR